ncbi:MAG: hypothetical protein HYY06_12540 [Deltaproteobacteria bacterium]|nr:hypothetical protein [Deltaproteobacteria bacterium]
MLRLLRRFLCALALALLCVQAAGVTKLFAQESCQARCPDDDEQGNCPSDCTDCACCGHLQPVASQVAPAIAAPPGAAPEPDHCAGSPPTADPRGTEHVPKPSRA